MTALRLRVRSVTREADAVRGIVLVDPEGRELPAWGPGAHIDLDLPVGSRQYSLCGDPGDRFRYRIAVLREPGGRGGSAHLHDGVAAGDLLSVRGPRNAFALEDATHYRFVAGGIGVTPLLPMIAEARRRGVPWQLVYGGRTRAAMAFLGELAGPVRIVAEDECGPIDLPSALAGLPEGGLVYCCGPAGLIDAVRGHCRGLPGPDVVRFERFSAPPSEAPDPGRSFVVELARTGATVTVGPGETILEKAVDAGADVGSDCRDGICGSCETPILAGRADHRDHVLTERERAEQRCLMICVSRAETDTLTLDL